MKAAAEPGMISEEDSERPSRLTGNERPTFRRTSIMVSTATASPLHLEKYNIFIRSCNASPLTVFLFLLFLMISTTIIGCAVFFSYRHHSLDKQGSTLVLSSGEGLIAKINSYVIDLPESECNGRISSYPDGRYSQNLFDVVTDDSEDDFFQPRKCKWVSDLSPVTSPSESFPYPVTLVGQCNINSVTSAYSEGVAIVFTAENLFKQSSLIGMCHVDNFIRNFKNYDHKCRSSEVKDACCPSRSLPNYVAALSDLPSCENITQDSIDYTQQLLSTCHPHYLDGSLTSDCWDWNNGTSKVFQCPFVPPLCTKYNAVYDMFHSLMESAYDPTAATGDADAPELKIGKLLIPYNETDKDWLLDLYHEKLKDRTGDTFGGAELTAYNLRIKTEVLEEILQIDILFLIPISFILLTSILIMTGLSLFLSFFSLLGIYLCFGMTWFVYAAVLWLEYAPFFIFFSLTILIYMGLLFLFSYLKNWNESFDVLGSEQSDCDRLAYVWHHSCLKNFAAAMSSRYPPLLLLLPLLLFLLAYLTLCSCCLFAIILFPLPSMKCFGLFSGISVLCLFLVAVFYFPTIVLLNHKMLSISSPFSSHPPSPTFSSSPSPLLRLWSSLKLLLKSHLDKTSHFFELYSLTLFNFKRSLFVLLLFATTLIGFYSFSIPVDDIATPQLLFKRHPFELYDRDYDKMFYSSPLNKDSYFPMVLIFGLKASNTIEPFNPSSKTVTQFSVLNISSVEEQGLMYDLCQYMISQKGRQGINITLQNIQCYPFFFQQWMSVPCNDTTSSPSSPSSSGYPDTVTWLTPQRESCCGYDISQKSYSEEEFLSCLYNWSAEYGSFNTGLWWDPLSAASPSSSASPSSPSSSASSSGSKKIMAVTIGMDSRTKFSNDYSDALDYWDELDHWTCSFFSETVLRKSYSTSNMALLRYQRGLIVGITVVSPLCICIGALVVYFMSRNVIAALSVFISTYVVLWILGGTIELYGERFSLFMSMSASLAMTVACGLSSFLSYSYCEAGEGQEQKGHTQQLSPGEDENKEIGSYLGKEVTPIVMGLTVTSWLTSLCLLGCGTYFSYGFGVIFIAIAFYCWVLPYTWNMLFLMIFWTQQPFGQLLVYLGLTPPPCCLVEIPQSHSQPQPEKPQTQVATRVTNPLNQHQM